MTIFILLAGESFSGKTTVAEYIKKSYPDTVELTFAQPLKDSIESVFLIEHEKLYNPQLKNLLIPEYNVTPRILMQKVGDLYRDKLKELIPELKIEYGTIFCDNLMKRIYRLIYSEKPPKIIVISDCRIKDEHDCVKSLTNSTSIRIIRNKKITLVENKEQSFNIWTIGLNLFSSIKKYLGFNDVHISEQINFKCDHTINNDGSYELLYSQVDALISNLFENNSST
jgi:hypothetical protein